MRLNHKTIFAHKSVSFLIFQFVCFYSRTFRFTVENEEAWTRYLNRGGRVLLCTWHQQFFSAIRYFRKYRPHNPHLMISPSKDGDIIAGVAELTGWHPVRGSSSKQGKKALRELILRLKDTRLAALVVDGPKGPIGEVKAGAIRLAHMTDAAIVPFYVSASQAWTFNSWDRFFIPKPYTSVLLRFGDMIKLDATRDPVAFEKQRAQLEKMMRKGLRL